uniref:DDE Tnp4 domain-containing protein n=1 Tax=Cyprinus carpio TaxID=7962 RepID=A0A8C1ZID6_CYPCA
CFVLFTGESFSSLSFQFRVAVSTIRQFIPETCSANYQVLKDKYLKGPDSVEQWQQVEHGFETQWNFPNCLGALDGKHSTLYDYKHSFSIVLMALVDSSYRFLYVDVGFNGQISDGGVFEGCSLQNALENRTVNIPASAPLPGSNQLTPYCIVADEAFPLKEYLMKPYPNRRLSVQQHIFNYRLSRSRRVVENTFACCALHNFLRTECGEVYMEGIDQEGPDHDTVPGRWRQDPDLLQAPLPNITNTTTQAKRSRDKYFIFKCAVHWAVQLL